MADQAITRGTELCGVNALQRVMRTHSTASASVRLLPLLLTLGLWLSAPVAHAEQPWEGTWQLNFEETDKVTITYDEGSGTGKRNVFSNATISVSGLPLPSRSRVPSQSRLPAKDPEVLLCNTMHIDVEGERINLAYDENETETLRKGDYRGRNTRWTKKEIRQKYKTPDRKVTKTWQMRPDGRLLVSVKINPRKDRSKTYNRVFDRVNPPAQPE